MHFEDVRSFWPEVEGSDDVTGSTDGFSDDDDEYTPPYIVTERMTCNITEAIRKNRLQDAGTQKRIVTDVAEGIAHLHGRRVVHRDVKPENVLVRLENGELIGNAKVCDFGISRRMRNAQQQTMYSRTGGPSGTIGYMPPEVLCNLRNCPSRKSWDVWSFGVLICYITVVECRTELSKLQPFRAENIAKSGELAKMMQGLASKVSDPVLQEVATMCLLEKEVDRPEMQLIVHILRGNDTVNVGISESEGNQHGQQDLSSGHLPIEECAPVEEIIEEKCETESDDEKHVEQSLVPPSNKPSMASAAGEISRKNYRNPMTFASWKQAAAELSDFSNPENKDAIRKRHFKPPGSFL